MTNHPNRKQIVLSYEDCYGPAKFRAREAARAKVIAKNAIAATTFTVGQAVRNSRRPFDRDGAVEGPIVKIEGANITISVRGTLRTFVSSHIAAI